MRSKYVNNLTINSMPISRTSNLFDSQCFGHIEGLFPKSTEPLLLRLKSCCHMVNSLWEFEWETEDYQAVTFNKMRHGMIEKKSCHDK